MTGPNNYQYAPRGGGTGRCRICLAPHYRKDEFCKRHAPERNCSAYKCVESITSGNKSGLCIKHRKMKRREE